MLSEFNRRGILLMVCVTMAVFCACSNRYFNRPDRERVATCSGKLREFDGRRVTFRLDLYRMKSSEVELFASFPGDGLWYRRIEDIDFGDNGVRIEMDSTSKVYKGEITGNLKFDGSWNGFAAAFKLKMND